MFGAKSQKNVHNLIMDEIRDVEICLTRFDDFLRVVATPDSLPETLKTLAEGIDKTEDDADAALRLMIDSLAKAPLLPATRQDLIEIATSCDRVANKCEHTAGKIVWQNFRLPREYAEPIGEIMQITREQFELLKIAISRLFSQFGELLRDHAILDEIRACESRVDKIETNLYTRIYAMDIGLAERMQMERVIELICDISDIIENIADRIQVMLITRKA